MRPERFQTFAIDAFRRGSEIKSAEPWQEERKRPYGVKVQFQTGAELWLAITVQSADGEKYSEPEKPVQAEPPAQVATPDPYAGAGKVSVKKAELHLAALLENAGSPEARSAYAYSAADEQSQHRGLGVRFHSGARAYMLVQYATRPGQARPTQQQEIPPEF